MMKKVVISVLLLLSMFLSACQEIATPPAAGLRVLAVETFLADITQHVAGERAKVDALIPLGLDPHAFEPSPKDVARIAESQVLVVNGAGFEEWLKPVLNNTGGEHRVIEASAGLTGRKAREGEAAESPADAGDPHFWLDPLNVVKYVENIRDGLTQADPAGGDTYRANAAGYISQLQELDRWVKAQVQTIPPEQRLLVTNHESLGYFADRYGFKIAGTIVPSVSSEASPSAQQLPHLIDQVRATHARAIFLETGSNPQLADQVAGETGAKVVTDLYTHSITTPDGPAPTYIDMIKANVKAIVDALK
jgi:ABC-type Zn uptake system ZnuABC Zn-binding protein ZnuA